jgi:hypothetical protein
MVERYALPAAGLQPIRRAGAGERDQGAGDAVVAIFLVWRERANTLSQIAYYYSSQAYLHSQDGEQKVNSVNGSANPFATLGTAPALGRSFTRNEQRSG